MQVSSHPSQNKPTFFPFCWKIPLPDRERVREARTRCLPSAPGERQTHAPLSSRVRFHAARPGSPRSLVPAARDPALLVSGSGCGWDCPTLPPGETQKGLGHGSQVLISSLVVLAELAWGWGGSRPNEDCGYGTSCASANTPTVSARDSGLELGGKREK